MIAVAANRAHTLLALARPRVGIEVQRSPEGPVLGTFSWPDLASLVPRDRLREASRDEPLRIEAMRLSGDGTRVLVIGYRQGVLLGSRRAGEPAWRYVGGAGEDMLHGDLSDDGRWLVHGSQGSLHEILSIRDDGGLEPHASIGPRSEYPTAPSSPTTLAGSRSTRATSTRARRAISTSRRRAGRGAVTTQTRHLCA